MSVSIVIEGNRTIDGAGEGQVILREISCLGAIGNVETGVSQLCYDVGVHDNGIVEMTFQRKQILKKHS
jgi:hypothetical protein